MESDVGALRRGGSRAVIAARFVAWGSWILMLALVIGSLLVWFMEGQKALPISFAHGALGVSAVALCAAVFTTVGTILATKLPRSPVGWPLLVIGMLFAFLTPVDLLIQAAFEVARPFPSFTLLVAWLMSSAMTPTIVGSIVTVCLVFPDGQLPLGRWRVGGVVAIAGSVLLAAASALEPSGLIWYPALPNPAALPATYAPLVAALRMTALAALVWAGLTAAACVVMRYRRAGGPVRRQLRWIVVGVGVMTAGLLPFLVARYALELGDPAGEALIAVAALACCVFPASILIAIVRQHLFDIDQVVSKTLVYVPLMGILAGIYTASLTLFQRLFVSISNNTSDAAFVLSALVLASVFAPIRSALESRVNRRFTPARATDGGADAAVAAAPTHDAQALGEPIAVPVSGAAPGLTSPRPDVLVRPVNVPVESRRFVDGDPALAARVSELEATLEELKRLEARRAGSKGGAGDATAPGI